MMSKSYVPNHSELVLTVKKWLDDVYDMYGVSLVDKYGYVGVAELDNAYAIERLATLLGDELEAFEDKTAEVFRDQGYDAGWEEGRASEREAQLDGIADARDDGYNEGWERGYDQGYSEGYTTCEEEHDIRTDS